MFSLKSLDFFRPQAALLLLGLLPLNLPGASAPVGVLRAPPLPTMAEKVNAFGYATDTNQTLQFLALLTLGQVGYPMFPGASRTENVGVVGFESGSSYASEMVYVILAKFAANSAVPGKIQAAGLAVKQVGGWTAMAEDPGALYYVNAGNIEDLLRLVRKERTFDFELEIERTPAELDAMQQRLSASATDPDAARGIDMAFSFLSNIQSSLFGINLDTERFQIGTRQVARAGSPEAALFSAPAGGEVPVARFVPAEGNAGFIYHTDPAAVTDFLKVFFQRMEAAGEEPEAAQLHDKLETTLQTIAEDWDGTGAYALTFQPEGVDYAAVVGGDWEQEPFSQLLDEFFNNTMPALLDELPIEQYASAVKMATSASQATGPISSALPGAMGDVVAGGSLNSLDDYEAPTHQIVDGMIVLSNQPARLESLAAAVAEDKTAADSVGDHLELADGQALAGYVDMKQIYLQSLQQMQLPATPSTTLALSQLAATDLAPMTIDVRTGDNTLTGTLTVPIETFRALSVTLQQIRQSSAEQNMR